MMLTWAASEMQSWPLKGDDKLLDEVENWAKLNELAEKQYGKKSKMCAIM